MSKPKKSQQMVTFLSILTLAALAVFFAHDPASVEAKPPGGGTEPVPAGTLYYLAPTAILGTLANGSGGEQAFSFNDSPHPEPSHLIYHDSGTNYRLWLRTEDSDETYDFGPNGSTNIPHQDLFIYIEVVGSNAEPVRYQLTDLFGSYFVNEISPRWSNDGEDSFISFAGIDLAGAFSEDPETGQTTLNGNGVPGIFHVDFTGSEIFAGAVAGANLVTPIVTGATGSSNFEHGWSKDGTKVAYLFSDGQNNDVWVMDLFAGTDQKIFDGSQFTTNPRFSPTADIVSVNDSGGFRLIDPVTLGISILRPSATGPYWSPDGNHLSFVETTQKGTRITRYLSRISLGSGLVTRVKELQGNIILPWVSQ